MYDAGLAACSLLGGWADDLHVVNIAGIYVFYILLNVVACCMCCAGFLAAVLSGVGACPRREGGSRRAIGLCGRRRGQRQRGPGTALE